jgi:hypothetical protein
MLPKALNAKREAPVSCRAKELIERYLTLFHRHENHFFRNARSAAPAQERPSILAYSIGCDYASNIGAENP